VQAALRYLIVDEYQGVNPAQERLIGLLTAGGLAELCVVGDDDQAIYQWRGSDVGNIVEFGARYRVSRSSRSPGTGVASHRLSPRRASPSRFRAGWTRTCGLSGRPGPLRWSAGRRTPRPMSLGHRRDDPAASSGGAAILGDCGAGARAGLVRGVAHCLRHAWRAGTACRANRAVQQARGAALRQDLRLARHSRLRAGSSWSARPGCSVRPPTPR
jgi:hypothetical protein